MTSDPDLESGLEYRIAGASTEKFSLDNHGELRLNQFLDREMNSGEFAISYLTRPFYVFLDYEDSYLRLSNHVKEYE